MKKLSCFFLLFFICFCVFAKTAPELYQLGQQYQAKEDWYSAIEAYQSALKINPAYGEVWYSLAKCSYATSQYDLVLTYLNVAEKYMGNNTEVQNLRGFAYLGLGKIEEARSQFLHVLEDNPNDIQSRFGLGELDIFDGKYSGAEQYYTAALKRDGESRKALLSLALVSDKLNKTESARNYIKQALTYHSGSAEVHYYAGYISAQENDFIQAEKYLRNAILLNGTYDKAYSLLATILYNEGRYQEAIDICDYRISVNRNQSLAWYLKALCYWQLNETENAVSTLTTALGIAPRDEMIRAALEMIVDKSLSLEDPRRESLSQYHELKGTEYTKIFYEDEASFEYLLALLLNPENTDARLAYATILQHGGFEEAYLSQLEFIQGKKATTQKIDDEIEALQSKLQITIPKKWDIDTLYLDKTRWDIRIFYNANQIELMHTQAQEVCAERITSYMRSVPIAEVTTAAASGFADAFRQATLDNQDYFILLSFEEAEREITMRAELYSTSSGNKLTDYTVYRTGNNRLSIAILKLVQQLVFDLPAKGSIIDRNVSDVLIDLGSKDGVTKGDEYTIIKKGGVYQEATKLGLVWNDADVLGTLSVVNVGEEVSEVSVVQKGFYDVINIGDEIVLKSKASSETQVENTTESNTANDETEIQEPVAQEFTLQKQAPILYDLIQSITN